MKITYKHLVKRHKDEFGYVLLYRVTVEGRDEYYYTVETVDAEDGEHRGKNALYATEANALKYFYKSI